MLSSSIWVRGGRSMLCYSQVAAANERLEMTAIPLTSVFCAAYFQPGEIDQPWNCPHGRPTMRHLADLAQVHAPVGATATGSAKP